MYLSFPVIIAMKNIKILRLAIAILAFIILAPMRVSAAEPVEVQPFEGEIHAGLSAIRECGLDFDAGVEVRYNVNKSPIAVGISLGTYILLQPYAAATVEYSFLRGRNVSPYIGTEIGAGYGMGFLVRPKVGVEFFNLFRVNANFAFQVSDTGYTAASLSLGIVIGGRPKKPKVEAGL